MVITECSPSMSETCPTASKNSRLNRLKTRSIGGTSKTNAAKGASFLPSIEHPPDDGPGQAEQEPGHDGQEKPHIAENNVDVSGKSSDVWNPIPEEPAKPENDQSL